MQTYLVFLLAMVTCGFASPVMFLTFEEDDGKSRLLECITPIGFSEGSKISYKCRVRSKTTVDYSGEKSNDIPLMELLKQSMKEAENGITTLEVSEEITAVPVPQNIFEAKAVIIDGSGQESDEYQIVQEPRKKKNQGGCEDDEVFVGELNICMPYAPHKVEPKTATLNQDGIQEVINPEHTILRVGYEKKKCPPGEIEIKDLGICAPINNCWPHPDCSHLDEKKVERSTNTELEEDD